MANYGENGGFWNAPKVQYSQQTHSLLKEMMQESKLTNFQQRHLEKQLRGGGSLPVTCNPTSSAKKKQPISPKKLPKVLNPKNYHNNIRTKEDIEASGAYERPKYEPGPSHWSKNSEKEKEKLANMMAFGQDIDPNLERLRRQQELRDMDLEEPRPVDRFDELQEEIDERREFLRDMEAVGQGEKYRSLIETQISQAIREMELIDKKRTKELEELLAKENSKRK
ncbi:UPF0193 protein EVG1-like [Dreissena polymorpha]|uniref:Uncharacterized protein n=1 Tax=Dreissena polymorpha TaxID=45954 RepID=A0A9D4RM24_DREPO|nr:UPF0193 protein EVG1-like [Dreissena polymorpha]KAH3873389.1 hypothetical protein DPMN_036624 [Dreissena polymorpha]